MKKILLIFLLSLLLIAPCLMAQTTINGLTEKTVPTSSDYLPLWDSSSLSTKKVQVGNLAQALSFGFVDAGLYSNLVTANAVAVAAGKLLYISSNYTLTANTTLTASIFVPLGGGFTKASTFTLAINGSFFAENYQVFFGFTLGTDLTFGSGALSEYRSAWIGGTTQNLGYGVNTFQHLTTGDSNVGVGYFALNGNTTGNENTAIGYITLGANTTGRYNIALGSEALIHNTTGNWNNGLGTLTLFSNLTGIENVAIGGSALYYNTTGSDNTGVGDTALGSNITGQNNVAVGYAAGAIQSAGSYNTFLGYAADTTGDSGFTNVTAIGNNAKAGASNTMALGGTGADAVKVGIGKTTPNSTLAAVGLPAYATNAAAISGGLTAGDFYRTGGDPDVICVVH